MSLPARYNPRFIKHYNDTGVADLQTLGEYGVSIIVARSTDPTCYRCIGVHHLSGQENGGKHHIFVDVLDEQGQRVNGALVKVQVGNNPPTYAPVDKPANEPGTNAPMWANTQYSIAVAYYSSSDTVIGLHTGHADEPGGGNTWGHHSFYVVFQRRAVGQPEPPPPPDQPEPPPPPPDDYTEALGLVVQALIELRQQVEALAADVATLKSLAQANDQRMKKTAAVWQQ